MEHPVAIGADDGEILQSGDAFTICLCEEFSVMHLAVAFTQRAEIKLAHLTGECVLRSEYSSLFGFDELTAPFQP